MIGIYVVAVLKSMNLPRQRGFARSLIERGASASATTFGSYSRPKWSVYTTRSSPSAPTFSGGVPAGSSGAQFTGSAALFFRSVADVVSELWYRSYDGAVLACTSPSHS